MVTECVAIIFLVLVLAYMMFRRGNRSTASAVLPIVVLPTAYLVAKPVSMVLNPVIPMLSQIHIMIFIVVTGLVIASIWIAFCTHRITQPTVRRVYLVLSVGFTLILAFIIFLRSFL